MYRSALRAAVTSPLTRNTFKSPASKRFASTASGRSGSWRGAAARWGLAGGLTYYYNTSSVFAEEPQHAFGSPSETAHESEAYRTVDVVAEQRRAQAKAQLQESSSQTNVTTVAVPDAENAAPGDPGALEEEASQQGAFNEETGEINWDCPCLGGMAHGPCGEQFRAAFSCFVFSKEEPKGVDCIEHFKTMQGCFREHPEVYGSELDEDEESPSSEGAEGQGAPTPVGAGESQPSAHDKPVAAVSSAQSKAEQSPSESDDIVPKSWHDSRESSAEK